MTLKFIPERSMTGTSVATSPRPSLRLAALAALAALIPVATPALAPPDHGKMATEEATPVGGGNIEIEAAYNPSFANHGTGGFERSSHAHVHGLSLGFFYGLTEHLDVKVAAGVAELEDLSDPRGPTNGFGMTDLVLGSRWRFLADADRALDVTLATTVVVPTGGEAGADELAVTQGYWSLRNALVASKDWGRATANAELAVTVPVSGGADGLVGALGANVAFGYAAGWFQPIAELNYDLALDADSHQRLAVTAGVNMTSDSGNRLLVGVQQALWGRNVGQSTTFLVAAKTAF